MTVHSKHFILSGECGFDVWDKRNWNQKDKNAHVYRCWKEAIFGLFKLWSSNNNHISLCLVRVSPGKFGVLLWQIHCSTNEDIKHQNMKEKKCVSSYICACKASHAYGINLKNTSALLKKIKTGWNNIVYCLVMFLG